MAGSLCPCVGALCCNKGLVRTVPKEVTEGASGCSPAPTVPAAHPRGLQNVPGFFLKHRQRSPTSGLARGPTNVTLWADCKRVAQALRTLETLRRGKVTDNAASPVGGDRRLHAHAGHVASRAPPPGRPL